MMYQQGEMADKIRLAPPHEHPCCCGPRKQVAGPSEACSLSCTRYTWICAQAMHPQGWGPLDLHRRLFPCAYLLAIYVDKSQGLCTFYLI